MAHLQVWHVMRATGFSFIWQVDEEYADTFWDGVFARSRTLFEVLETFGLFLVVPRVLWTQRNFAILRCPPEYSQQWQVAAKVFAVLVCYINDMNMEVVLSECRLPEDPMTSPWFIAGLRTLHEKGLIDYDQAARRIELVEPPEPCRRYNFNHEVTAAGFYENVGSGRVSQGLHHPNPGRVRTDCEHPTDPWVLPRLRGLVASGQVKVRTKAPTAHGLVLHPD